MRGPYKYRQSRITADQIAPYFEDATQTSNTITVEVVARRLRTGIAIMSFSASKKVTSNLLKLSPSVRRGIQQVRKEVLGHAPQLNQRTGYQFSKKQLTGVYLHQYYLDPIEKFARMVSLQCKI
jgi:hypothetical protein